MNKGKHWASVLLLLVIASLSGCGLLPSVTALPPMEPDQVRALQLGPDMDNLAEFYAVPEGTANGFGEAERRTLRVRNIRCDGLGTGTGFAIDTHTIITNRHVVEGLSSIELTTHDGRDIAAKQVLVAAQADLAIITTDATLDTVAQFRDEDPFFGEQVSIIGFPEGGRMTVSTGTILGFTEDPENAAFGYIAVTDAIVAHGSSGSALLDADGAVIGVVYAKTVDGWSMAIPITTLRELLQTEGAFTEISTCDGGGSS